ncbi:MAG TPA: molybdenum cofactor guanylyltransferase [Dehalococcoidales bacterium]|nr:molybdenum cofactor guanylyltransferase [Dehalococcoidales bacterium]
MEISSIVLAGGKSSRFGHDKVFKTVGDQNLLDLVINRVSLLSQETILVTAGRDALVQSDKHHGLRTVTDVYPGKGPLGGVYTGLLTSKSCFNLVVASDMPFLNTALLRHMIQVSAGFDLVVPRIGGLVEPLHAIYARTCLEPMAHLLRRNELSIHQLFPMVSTRYVEADEIEQFDPEHLSFFNVNTRADLVKAEEIAQGMKR